MDAEQITQEPPPRRIRFGPGPTHSMALPDAEKLLCSLRDKHPAIFGNLMLEVYGIEMPQRRRAVNGQMRPI